MIDAHSHLENEAFDEDREEIIARMADDGLDAVVNVGSDIETSRAVVQLAREYEKLYAVVGVHPQEADGYSEAVREELVGLSRDEKVVAIGEVGLDYYYENSPRAVQREVFSAMLDLAVETDLPVVIHSRDAAEETFNIVSEFLDRHPSHHVLIHCYSYSVEMLARFIELGCYISLGGVTTFKNAKVPKRVAETVDIDRLLLETDCPYMTPEPHRGKRNEPKYVRFVAENIANLRGMDVETLIAHTDENTKRFYRWEQ
ncbi:MAG: TatD family hydrolase [Peptoniphilus sp.]|nr:TatD family hydrolase [Peptoniphilus sp.]MDD7362601.1 TatD family hydrolase [Bacillota bacterium]MDY6045000.1 TatD family hydrolase [Peptoniphilus sp.]